ncbi:hypothetical protein FNV43_RR04529 [Rhamnella rubrinervis]|uniref:Beta-lactamase-related domain-containing protein n=1 Tax=Rhamnella rubrinervis TaxID=2594499 RepID=A0A8K0HJR3_9ROSA|nr:hypothetical protein FNV43_RR04529 [Rhamnella rubrinervis]
MNLAVMQGKGKKKTPVARLSRTIKTTAARPSLKAAYTLTLFHLSFGLLHETDLLEELPSSCLTSDLPWLRNSFTQTRQQMTEKLLDVYFPLKQTGDRMDNDRWIYDSPVHSDVEAKLRKLLFELRDNRKVLGIQVCAYKDGEVIIDTSAGVLGENDPRPVQPDNLFPVFSATKAVTSGILHWLVDNGKLKLDEMVASIWPEFGSNGKDLVKHASGKKFQEILEEAFIYPLQIEGELYVGIPPGKCAESVENRLATLTLNTDYLNKLSGMSSQTELPSTFQPGNIFQLATTLTAVLNKLNFRRAIIPSASGNCSACAVARYYAALVDGGVVPPLHSSSSKRQLEYGNLVYPKKYGLGFKRYTSKEGSPIGFGHSGMGGWTGLCDVENRFTMAVTLNCVSFGSITADIVQLVCSELNIPIREKSW